MWSKVVLYANNIVINFKLPVITIKNFYNPQGNHRAKTYSLCKNG